MARLTLPLALALVAIRTSCVRGAAADGGSGAAALPVWPLPASASAGSVPAWVLPGSAFFRLAAGVQHSQLLLEAFGRYQRIAFPRAFSLAAQGSQQHPVGACVAQLEVDVADTSEEPPRLGTNESYSLSVHANSSEVLPWTGGGKATLTALTVYGALRGLETFSQLVQYDFDSGFYMMAAGLPIEVGDEPRFPHRGLMVDTSRHFLPTSFLRGIIDTLPYAKLNVLHWHVVDIPSFPLESASNPKLWKGAFSPRERYTLSDVRELVEYARLRGVRVFLELDMPGHADSWCKGYPEVCPSPDCTSPLNVASNATWALVESLIEEFSRLVPDELFHLGGDEVNTRCWSETPSIAAWLSEQSLTPGQAYGYFTKRAAEHVVKQGKRPVQWSEVFAHFKGAIPKETIVHVWLPDVDVGEITSLGYNVLRNVAGGNGSWYLDYLGVTWKEIYQNEPCAGLSTEEHCKLVLGGNGEMWGETVDGSDLQNTVWPRLAAIAERLWSQRAATADVAAAEPRLQQFRCLLLERGVAAAPLENKVARQAPAGPSSCAGVRAFEPLHSDLIAV